MDNELSDAYQRWLLAHRLSPETIRTRGNFLRRIVAEIGDPAEIDATDISVWLAPWSGWTLASYFYAMHSVMTFMQETERRPDHPMVGMRRPAQPKPAPKPFEDHEVDRILAAARGNHRVQIELGLYAGLRVHEVVKVDGRDVTETKLRVLGKGNKLAHLPTHERLWELAERFPRDGWWFPSTRSQTGHLTSKALTGRTTRLFADLGMDGSFHRLRATYGTRLLRAGINIRVVQRLMRHDSLASTEHYLGVAENELEAAIAALGRPTLDLREAA